MSEKSPFLQITCTEGKCMAVLCTLKCLSNAFLDTMNSRFDFCTINSALLFCRSHFRNTYNVLMFGKNMNFSSKAREMVGDTRSKKENPLMCILHILNTLLSIEISS